MVNTLTIKIKNDSNFFLNYHEKAITNIIKINTINPDIKPRNSH